MRKIIYFQYGKKIEEETYVLEGQFVNNTITSELQTSFKEVICKPKTLKKSYRSSKKYQSNP